jgi:hypothetical protein
MAGLGAGGYRGVCPVIILLIIGDLQDVTFFNIGLYIIREIKSSLVKKESMDHHQDIIDLIKSTPMIEPPNNLTPRVMAAVMKAKERSYARVWNFLSMPREFTLDPIRALHTGIDNNQRSLYFLLVAFAHLILTAVLFIGLRNMVVETLIPPIIRLQPWVSLLLAGWLVFWASLLKKNTKAGIKGAKFATLLYIEAVVINGVLLIMEFKPVLLLVPFFVIVAGIGVTAGIFLAMSGSPGNKRITEGPTTAT